MKFNPALSFPGIRARSLSQGDLTANFGGGVNIPVREILLGQPSPIRYLGDDLFRPIPAAWNFQYYKYGVENRALKSAERPMRAVIQASDARIDSVTGKLRRYTWASVYDMDEIAIANEAARAVGLPLNIQAKGARDARMIVNLAVEKARSVVALASASYSSSPDLDDTLASGSEWDDPTNGDSRTSIRSMASRIAAANNVQIENIDVYLTHASFEAAQNDPVLLAKLQYTGGAITPDAATLAKYWGVGNVFVGDAHYNTTGALGAMTSMYGDVAILRVSRDLPQYDTTEGALDSFVAFQWSGPSGPLAPWLEEENSSWYFPYQAYEQAVTVNTAACGIIRNCKA